MNKRFVVTTILLFSWLLYGVYSQSILTPRPGDPRHMLFSLGGFIAFLYIGLDAVLAPETSFLGIVQKYKPFYTKPRPTLIRAMGLFVIFMSFTFISRF